MHADWKVKLHVCKQQNSNRALHECRYENTVVLHVWGNGLVLNVGIGRYTVALHVGTDYTYTADLHTGRLFFMAARRTEVPDVNRQESSIAYPEGRTLHDRMEMGKLHASEKGALHACREKGALRVYSEKNTMHDY
jgi:hypothetical protein